MIESKVVTPGEGGGSTGGCVRTYVVWTTDHTMTTDEVSNTLLSNYGQTENVTWTLPTAAEGYDFIAQIGALEYNLLTINPQASDHIYLDGVKLSAGEGIRCTSPQRGDNIWFWVIKESEGNFSWIGHTGSGSWGSATAMFWIVNGGSTDGYYTPRNRKMDLSEGNPGSWVVDVAPPMHLVHTSGCILDGIMFHAFGQLDAAGTGYEKMRSFNPGLGSWSGEMDVPLWDYMSISFVGIGAKGYVTAWTALGSNPEKTHTYNKITASWSVGATDWGNLRSQYNGSFASKETSGSEFGVIYVGGFPNFDAGKCLFYTPSLDTLTSKTYYPKDALWGFRAFRKNDSEGHCVGGFSNTPTDTYFNYNEKFIHSGSGAWSSETVFPLSGLCNAGEGSTGCSVAGKGYVTGDKVDDVTIHYVATCTQYNEDVWTTMTPYLPVGGYVMQAANVSYGENPV